MTDTATEPSLNLLPAVASGGNHDRNEDRNGERNEDRYGSAARRDMVLCASQDEIDIAFDGDGDAIITQKRWPDEDQTIIISRENLDTFIDRLTDALGIPSFGRP